MDVHVLLVIIVVTDVLLCTIDRRRAVSDQLPAKYTHGMQLFMCSLYTLPPSSKVVNYMNIVRDTSYVARVCVIYAF